MIRVAENIPSVFCDRTELIKIRGLFECYPSDGSVMFWEQDNGRAFISMADSDMTVWNNGADTDELAKFVNMLAPSSVFSDSETLEKIGLTPFGTACVMAASPENSGETKGDGLSSKEIYDIFFKAGLYLPEYEHFATDYCRRKNRGLLDSFALKDKCAAVWLKSGGYALLNGIASLQKGYGGLALTAALQKSRGQRVLAYCRENITGFYEKYGFCRLYEVGSWVKTDECE